MKKYKCLVSALLCTAMLFVGCNHNPATPDDPADDPTNTEQPGTDETKSKYTVTFNSNGGSDVEAQVIEAGSLATQPDDPTSEGLYFAGWYTDEDCTEPFDFATKIEKDITLYAKWSSDPVYTVTIKYNDKDVKDSSVKATKDAEYKVTAPKCPKDGYTVKWYSDEACTKEVDFTKPLEGDTTIYAKYTAISYTIEYVIGEDNGTNATTNPATYTIESEIVFAAPTTTTSRKWFLGWYTDAEFKTPITKIAKGTTGNIKIFGNWSDYTIWNGNIELGTNWDKGAVIPAEIFTDITTEDEIMILGSVGTEGYHLVKFCSNTDGWPKLEDLSAAIGGKNDGTKDFAGTLKFKFSQNDLDLIRASGLVINGYDSNINKIKIYKEKSPVVLPADSEGKYPACSGRGLAELEGYSDDAIYKISISSEIADCTTLGYGVGCFVYWDEGWSGSMKQLTSLSLNADEALLAAATKATVVSIPLKSIKDALKNATGNELVGYGWNTWEAQKITINQLSIVDLYN